MVILGIDPGLSGAVAVLNDGRLTAIVDMPAVQIRAKGRELNLPDLASQLSEVIRSETPHAAWIESVHAMPSQGVSSSFKFGRCYGEVRGIIAAHAIPIKPVTPHEWKKVLRLGQGKDAARALASAEWPDMAERFRRVKDDGRAEAALIALYGWRQMNGRIAA